MDFYWADKTKLSATEIEEKLRSDEDKAGFYSTFIGAADAGNMPPDKTYYAQGERMYSEICTSSDLTDCKPQYLNAFPLPFANVYGMCNNYSSAAFMESESNECTQIVDLVSDCEITLNPEFYTTRVKVSAGQAQSSDNPPMTITSVYKLTKNSSNSSLIEYTDTGSTAITASVFNDSQTSCSNVLKEIAYTVKVSEVKPSGNDTTKPYLKIDSIEALVVLQDEPVTAVRDDEGKAMVSVQQRFSITFEKMGTSGELVGGKSGNPGYIDGLPMLLGKKDQSSGAVSITEDGFRVRGGDSTGKCIEGSFSSNLSEMGDPVLKFNVDLSYGCSMVYNLQELKDNCSSANSPLADLEIFKNLETIDTFGRFGNAYVYYPKVSAL